MASGRRGALTRRGLDLLLDRLGEDRDAAGRELPVSAEAEGEPEAEAQLACLERCLKEKWILRKPSTAYDLG